MQVPWSDIDGYRHTNYIAYIRYCDNAAMDAMEHSFLTAFQGDIYDYEIKKISLLYQKESKAGEELCVSVWEDESSPYILHFHVDRDGERLLENTIEYYEPQT